MEGRGILKSKLFLYLTEFFAGMSVMAVELGASRLMAPYFSSSQIVWTVIIGVIMIAMALGNLWGGRRADKNPDPSRLYLRMLIAAVWIALIPFAGRYLIAGLTLLLAVFVTKNFLVWAALATCLVIFAFPCVLLGTVTPSLVKYTTESLSSNGRTVGALGALNTVGSIIGTFLPTFVTIPAVGTAATFVIFSAVLALIAIVYFVFSGKRRALCLATAVVIAVLGALSPTVSFAFWEDVALEEESIYNYIQVKEDDEQVVLSTNVLFGVQSIKMKNAELTGMYYDYALAAPVMAGVGEDSDILILGLGSGTFASLCDRYFPGCRVEGVEIDRKIADLAQARFDMPDTVAVSVYDGRAYLADADKRYDVIMVDAYQDITIPFQLSSVEFFTLVRDHLAPGGVMVVNMNMVSDAEDSINDWLCDTICSVFGQVTTVPVAGGTNCELFATVEGGQTVRLAENMERAEYAPLRSMMGRVSANLTETVGQGRIFTDDKAPVELLGMRVLDELIGRELDYYRGLYLGR